MCCSDLLKIQDAKFAKNSPSAHYRTTLSGYIFATKACIDNRKKMLNTNITSTDPHNIVNFGQLTAEIGWHRSMEVNQTLHDVWPSPWPVHYARHSNSVRQPNCGVQQRAPPIFGRAAIALGIGPTFKFVLIRYDQTTSRSLQLSMSYMKQNISAAEKYCPGELQL